MKKKFLVLIEDDWENMGNGYGNVADLQYLPSLAMMNIMDRYDAKMTFMVDVAHQFVLKEFSHIPEVRVQSRIWDESVMLMKERGFDVQLHLHPQWLGATYKDGMFYVDREKWNIGLYEPAVVDKLVGESVDYLHNLLGKSFPDYSVCAFKAGSWGMQPSEHVLSAMERHGINLIMGVREGIFSENQGINYVGLEEPRLPYSPAMDDLTRIATTPNNLTMLPLQPYSPDLLTFGRLIADHYIGKYTTKERNNYYHLNGVPGSVRGLDPVSDKKNFSMGIKPYQTHLKIGRQPFSYLKASFDSVIRELDRYDVERIPVVIESHTKQYHNHYAQIEKLIEYIATKYHDCVEFGDMASLNREIQQNPSMVKTHAVT